MVTSVRVIMDEKLFFRKHKLKTGDVVEIKDGKGTYEGTVIPSVDKKCVVLKLESGYNIGIKIAGVKSVKKMGVGKKVGKAAVSKAVHNPKLENIAILHTGGTIAGRVDYRTGAIVSSFSAEDLLTMFPELSELANFRTKLVTNLFSEDLRFVHVSKIAKAVEKEIKEDKGGLRGIIIPHGTDTLAYTAAGLEFIFENLPVPVILVGAQRSSDRGSSDAAMNLICAAHFILKTDFAGMGMCMHKDTKDDFCVILPPTKTRKLHTSRRDAFRSVNTGAIAEIDYRTNKIAFLEKGYPRRNAKKKFTVKPKMEDRVAILKVHPNMMPEQFDFYLKQKYKGLVIEGTGLGQAPVGIPNKECEIHGKNLKAIEKLVESGCVVAMASQCIFGRVQMHVYEDAVDLSEAGVISAEDMLAETALMKLSWLLGNFPKKEVPGLFMKNMRGEITACTEPKRFEGFK